MKVLSVTYLFAALLTLPSLIDGQERQSNVSTVGRFAESPDKNASRSSPSEAEAVLLALVGRWHFDVYSQGRTVPAVSGEREMQLLDDSTKLAWTETFVGQSRVGSGTLGYNSATGAWYLLGVYTHEAYPVVLIGRRDPSTHALHFDPVEATGRPGTFVSSELRLVDAEHFHWVASDGGWRVVFTRIGPSAIKRF